MQLLIDFSILPRLSVLGGVILSYIVSRKKETFILPVSELEKRRERLAIALSENGIESALIDEPVEKHTIV